MNRTFVIAEAGVNHNGNLKMAKELVSIAKDAGADAVKFQTFRAEQLASIHAPKAEYQAKTTAKSQSQYQMLKELELTHDMHQALFEHCKNSGIEFLSTPFDVDSLDYLMGNFNLKWIKLSSGDLTTGPLLLAAARTQKSIILSTGMSTLDEIEQALKVIAYGLTHPQGDPTESALQAAYENPISKKLLLEKVSLLHCVTEYPAPFEDVNLHAMATLKNTFHLPVGLSDHTEGNAVVIAATALGAQIIEKHFTLDKNLPGPDHRASLSPDELKAMVKSIRQVELALGTSQKQPSQAEIRNRSIARKSLIALEDIRLGEPFTKLNLGMKRPGLGLSPMLYWELLGKLSQKDFKKDTLISL